ncbi:Fe-S cluster assembly protein SufD [Actinomyces vulturis]|uniref:Fe-S cluster assembly protein SufD n=1 Tax=Actinomyces vulturis TaxID=1857645 RepID=UPI0008365980|nr:Fe-S cluster assembly protein SufD [Actinomyces vulturis]
MTQLSTDHSRATLDGAHTHGGPRYVASRGQRPTSFDIADFPMPRGREEEWRFTPMKRFAPILAEELTDATSWISVDAPEGISVETVERSDSRVGTINEPIDRASVCAWENATQATIVTVGKNVTTDRATTVTITAKDNQPSAQHLVIQAESGSTATVILDHHGTGQLTQSIEVAVASDANLTLVSVQDWDDETVHASNHRVRVDANGKLKHVVVSLGGDVRICPDMGFGGEGGHIDSYGVYFTSAGQHQEHRPYVAHTEPHCYSRVTYKGALQGKNAHAVWVGDCLIGAAARGTDTYELNRNLVLTQGAKADSVPNLEIENGQIEGAGHASATGRFDDEQLFYLRARGIPEHEARRLVVLGFFNEIVSEIGVEEIEERLMEAIETELSASALLD